ncbi:putative ribonuclease H-like domain-containing protein [Tanacetum coccineum]
MAMLSVRVHKFEQKAGRKINFDKKESARFNKKKEIGKKEEDSKALITVDTLVDWTDHDGQSDGVIASKEFGMIAGCDTEDAIEEGAAKIYNLITGADTKEVVLQVMLENLLSWVSLLSTHLIKDCDFYEKQMANKTVGNGVGPVHSRNHVNHQNQFVPQAVLLRTGKVNIPPGSPQPVPTGKPKVPAPVPTGRQNRPFPVPTDRGYSPSLNSGWWKSTARPMAHLNRPTSSYFQTYTPYVPQMYNNDMQYSGVRWQLLLSPQQVVLGKDIEKENSYTDAEDEGIFDSGCSRSMLLLLTAVVRVINSPCYHNKELASPEQTATAEVVPKSVAGSSFPAASSTKFHVFSSQDTSRLDVCCKVIFQTSGSRYVVPTGRVVVPTGRYIVPAGKVIIIVSTGRLSLVPTGSHTSLDLTSRTVIGVGERRDGGLFYFRDMPPTRSFKTTTTIPFDLWHKWLGHPSLEVLKLLPQDLGNLNYFLGIEVTRAKEGIFLCQRKYALDIISEVGLLGAKPAKIPMEQNHHLGLAQRRLFEDPEQYPRLVGRLIYLCFTRPDLAYSMHILSQFMQNPQIEHWEAEIRVVRDLKGSPGQGNLDARHVHTKEQVADFFTKALGKAQFDYLLRKLGVQDLHLPT